MNSFDQNILFFFNQFSHHFMVFDHLVEFLENSNLLKSAIYFAFLWACWLQPAPDLERRRKILLATLAGCTFSIMIARILALTLPFRNRPLNESQISFVHPFGISQHTLEKWSSFPSDHAALFFGLTMGCFLIKRRYGMIAAVYTLVMVMLPRVYLGFHYPSDIVVGGLIGMLTVWLANQAAIRETLARICFGWLQRSPASFYICFFLVSYQFVVLFDDVRSAGHFTIDAYKYLHAGVAMPEN